MSELDLRRSPWNEGLGISSEFLDRQLFTLGCIVHASASFDLLGEHPLLELRRQLQEAEIGRLLLTIAVAVRNALEQSPSRAEYWLQGVKDDVGELRVLRSKWQESALSFREACNKLIHCVSINFHYVADKPKRGMALVPFVHLYGEQRRTEWKATIDINAFIGVASRLT